MRRPKLQELSKDIVERISPFNSEEILGLSLQSHKLLTIRCVCGDRFEDQVKAHFSRGFLCSSCSKRNKRTPPDNNLVAVGSPMVAEWDFERNADGPEWFSEKSGKKVWLFSKDCGHHFLMRVAARSNGAGCAVCNGKQVDSGVSDLATLFPHLVQEWSPRNRLSPSEVPPKSNQRFWWVCENGHEWRQKPLKRTDGYGCASCSRSQMEKDFSRVLQEFGIEFVENDRTLIAPLELDFVLPEFRLAIELNGNYWHSEEQIQKTRQMSAKNFHEIKVAAVEKVGFRLLFIWEKDWKGSQDLIVKDLRSAIKVPDLAFSERLQKTFFED